MKVSMLLITAVLLAACAQPAARYGNFQATQFVPEMRGAAVYGFTSYDSLPEHLQAGAAKLGYKAGDRIPTRRYSDDHPDRSISFLKPPAKNLRSTNPNDWARFNP